MSSPPPERGRDVQPGAVAPPGAAARLGTRDFFSRCAATVNLITCEYGGVTTGMTATSVCSLSLDLPSALVCINRQARTCETIMRAGAFVINVLSQGQQDLANNYSRPGSDKSLGSGLLLQDLAQITKASYSVVNGVAGALMCRVERNVDFGSHSIFIGRVEHVYENPRALEPLVYHDRRYVSTLAHGDEDVLLSLQHESLMSAIGW